MKIALVCDWFLPRLGGIERHLAQLAGRLAERAHEVTVITSMKGANSSESGVRLQPIRRGAGGLHLRDGVAPVLGDVLVHGDFDVVHAHASIVSPTAFAGARIAAQLGIPVVLTQHSVLGRTATVFRVLDRFVHWSRWPVLYSGVSCRVAEDLRALVGPVLILPNAIDPDEWQLPMGKPEDAAVSIVSVMRLVRRKRGNALLQAMARVASRLPPGKRVCLQIAGDGPERPRLERKVRALGLSEIVQFHGALSPAQVKRLLAGSHFFVLPSRLEAFGLAALEARGAGLPVIAMRNNGVSEFITDGVDGLLAGNDAELADHILRLSVDISLRRNIAAHNRAVPVHFTWDQTLRAHLAAYNLARACRLPRTRAAAGRPIVPSIALPY